MCVTIVDIMFTDWLLSRMSEKHLSQAELARRSGLTKQAIGNYVAGRTPDEYAIRKLAYGLKLPPEEVFRAAGLLPPNPEANEYDEEGSFLLRTLNPRYKKRAINQLKLLHQEQEDEGRDGTLNPAVEPR